MRPRVFPAENLAAATETTQELFFNEAAGIPRGKPAARGFQGGYMSYPSMRPRVFPAENAQHESQLDDLGLPSMRPRVFPAENVQSCDNSLPRLGPSMRPRVFPAENELSRWG